jgi:hypothetical protein
LIEEYTHIGALKGAMKKVHNVKQCCSVDMIEGFVDIL